MDTNKLAKSINKFLNKERIRRLLIQYFSEIKHYEDDFEALVYPLYILDLPNHIPGLEKCIEIIPYVDHADIFSGAVSIGWNLAVSGQQIMGLGKTTHTNVADLKSAINSNKEGGKLDELKRNPEEIIDFIMRHMTDANTISSAPSNLIMPGNVENSVFYRKPY